MTKGRKNFVGIVLLCSCVCPAVEAQAGSLHELVETQESALRTLERKLAGRNPYQQWGPAQEAIKTVRKSFDNVARESRSIEQERAALDDANRQLSSEKEVLLKDLQALKTTNKGLLAANENLSSENKKLKAQNERIVSAQGFLWMAFYTALALAFLGFGGLLVRIPSSRLERTLRRLEIEDLENKLKKEAFRARREGARPPRAARPMAERKGVDIRLLQAESTGEEPKEVTPESSSSQDAMNDKGRAVGLGAVAKKGKPESTAEAASSSRGEDETNKAETKPKPKRKKKTRK